MCPLVIGISVYMWENALNKDAFLFYFLATEHASSMPFKKTSMVDDKTTVGHLLLLSPQCKSPSALVQSGTSYSATISANVWSYLYCTILIHKVSEKGYPSTNCF